MLVSEMAAATAAADRRGMLIDMPVLLSDRENATRSCQYARSALMFHRVTGRARLGADLFGGGEID